MQIFYHEVNWMHFQDCALICHFYCYDYEHLAEALSGRERDRVWHPRHPGRRRAGADPGAPVQPARGAFRADDDRLPRRVMTGF